jgi:hypothetical protein
MWAVVKQGACKEPQMSHVEHEVHNQHVLYGENRVVCVGRKLFAFWTFDYKHGICG